MLADSAYGSGETARSNSPRPGSRRCGQAGAHSLGRSRAGSPSTTSPSTTPDGSRRVLLGSPGNISRTGMGDVRSGVSQLCAARTVHHQRHRQETKGPNPTTRCNAPPAHRARNTDWQNEYRQHRPMVERSIAWLTRGNRKVRYRGVARNDHWLHHRAAALNLRRLTALGLDAHRHELGPSLTTPGDTRLVHHQPAATMDSAGRSLCRPQGLNSPTAPSASRRPAPKAPYSGVS